MVRISLDCRIGTKEFPIHACGDFSEVIDCVVRTHDRTIFSRNGYYLIEAPAHLAFEGECLAPLSIKKCFLQRIPLDFEVAFPNHCLDVVLKEHCRAG